MAIKLDTTFPGRVDPVSAEWPLGEPRDRTAPGNGTPLVADWLKDIEALRQAVITRANITPSDTPDTAVSSQWLDAFETLFHSSVPLTDYAAARALDSSTLTDGQWIYIQGYTHPWEVQTGNAVYNGWFLPFDDAPTTRYLESTSPQVYAHLFRLPGDADDVPCLYRAALFATDHLIFEGQFTLTSMPQYTTLANVYIPLVGKNDFVIEASKAIFNVNYDFVVNTSIAGLIGAMGSSNVEVDTINFAGLSATSSNTTYGLSSLYVSDDGTVGSENIRLGSINGKNLQQAVRCFLTGGNAEYIANGFDSPQRSKKIRIGSIDVDYCKYGLGMQLSGDDTIVGKLRIKNYHRAIIAYGVDTVKAEIHGTNNAAAAIAIGAYGSIKNFNLKFKEDGQDVVNNTAANIAQVSVYDVGTSGGYSLDVQAGRTHYLTNIKIDFDVDVADRSVLCWLGKEGENGADSPIVIEDIEFTGKAKGVNLGYRLAQSSTGDTPDWSNTELKNISVSLINVGACYGTMRQGFKNSPIIKSTIVDHFYWDYEGAVNEHPIVFENCTIAGSVLQNGFNDTRMLLFNSWVNTTVQSGLPLQPINKKFIASSLGSSNIIDKGYTDIYTHNRNSSAIHSPESTTNNLVGGKFYEGSNTDTVIDVDLIAEASGSIATSTTAREIYHESFQPTIDFVNSNTKRFVVYVRNTSATVAALFTGYLVMRGPALTDFSACTVLLTGVQVDNILGSSYVLGDLSVSAPDADTIRFSMSRLSEAMLVTLHHL